MFIEIPLKRNDREFEVFRPYSLPYYDNGSKEFISIRNFKDILLAVSRDRQRVTTSNASRHQEGIYTIGPADLVTVGKTAQRGLIALFGER
jgi:hypothetical protein